MFGMGMPEILVILAVALIVIGPKKLPDLAKSLGRAINEFRKATTDLKESLMVDPEIKGVTTSLKDQHSAVVSQPEGKKAPIRETSGANTEKPATSSPDVAESEKDA